MRINKPQGGRGESGGSKGIGRGVKKGAGLEGPASLNDA